MASAKAVGADGHADDNDNGGHHPPPVDARSATATLIQIPMSIEEAAISLGAKQDEDLSSSDSTDDVLRHHFRRDTKLVSIVTEVSSAAILYNNRSITLTVGTYTAVNRGNLGEAAAFAAVTTVLTAISLVIYLIINKGKQMEL